MIPRTCRAWKIVPSALAGGGDPPGRQSRFSKFCGCGPSIRSGARTSWRCSSAGRGRISTSKVGRILTYLKARGQLVEPLRNGVKARRGPRPRPYAVRKPQDYRVEQPGDLCRWSRWMYGPFRAWCRSTLREGTWSLAGT